MGLAVPAAIMGVAATRSWADLPAAESTGPLFNPSRLHETRLDLSPADWKSLRDNVFANTYYAADLRVDADSVTKVGIRSRGDGSRFRGKPALKIDVNRYVKGQKFRGLKSLILKNHFEDETGLRERLAFAVFEAMGIAAPRNAFTRLTVNGEYRGVYSLVEPVRGPFLRARLKDQGGNLFDYQYETDPEVFYNFGDRGPNAKAYVPRPFKPRTHKRAPDAAALIGFLRALNRASDARVVDEVSRYLDIRQFVTYLAVENALADTDGFGADSGRNNFFLYQSSPKAPFVFIPWDKDMSLRAARWPVFLNTERNVLSRRLLKDPGLRKLYHETVSQVVERYVNPAWLLPRLEQGYRQVRESFLADHYQGTPARMYDLRVQELRRVIEGRPKGILPGNSWS